VNPARRFFTLYVFGAVDKQADGLALGLGGGGAIGVTGEAGLVLEVLCGARLRGPENEE
jgi:hypothetical protein